MNAHPLIVLAAIGACAGHRRSAQAADLTVWGLQAFNQAADEYIGQMVEGFRQVEGDRRRIRRGARHRA